MKLNLDNPGEDVQIQIVPLIDVIFCILTFFILASLQLTKQQAAIQVNVPSAETGDRQQLDRRLVSIDPVGQVYLDGTPISQDQLKQQLVGYYQLNPAGMVVVNADKNVRYESVLQIFDLVRAIGGSDRVALGVASAPGSQPAPASPSLLNPYSSPTTPYNPYNLPNSTPGADPLFPNPGQLPGSSPSPGSLFNPAPTVPAAPGTGTLR